MNSDNVFCGKNLFPSESNKPNEIECAESTKLMVHFKLKKHSGIKTECSWIDQHLTDTLLGLEQTNRIQNVQNSSNEIIQHSFLVPCSFDLNALKLPNNIFNCNTAVKAYSVYYFFCFLLLLAFIIFCWRYMISNHFQYVNSNRKIVTFYLSIFVEKHNQDTLKDIVTTYIGVLKV